MRLAGYLRPLDSGGAPVAVVSLADDSGERLVIRGCEPHRVTDVLTLWCSSRKTPARPADRSGLRQLMERDPEALLLAELRGRLVGSLIAAWDGWRGNMYRLTVHPEHQGRRIALQLLQVGEERLRARGARRISALVWREDDRALHVWRSAGYEHEEGTGRFVKTIAEGTTPVTT